MSYFNNVCAVVTVVVSAALALFVSPVGHLVQGLFEQHPWMQSDAALSVYLVAWVGGVFALANIY